MIVQRRCIRLKTNLKKGDLITLENIECLRPAPKDTFLPYQTNEIIGKKIKVDKCAGDSIYKNEIEG